MKEVKRKPAKYPTKAVLSDGSEIIVTRQSKLSGWLKKHGCPIICQWDVVQFVGVKKKWNPSKLLKWAQKNARRYIKASLIMSGELKCIKHHVKGYATVKFVSGKNITAFRITQYVDNGAILIINRKKLKPRGSIHYYTAFKDGGKIYTLNFKAGQGIHSYSAKFLASKCTRSGKYAGMIVITPKRKRDGIHKSAQYTATGTSTQLPKLTLTKGQKVCRVAYKHIGTKYKNPSTTWSKGVDCGGLIVRSYYDALGIAICGKGKGGKLVNNTKKIRKAGKRVKSIKDAVPGDIICYRSKSEVRRLNGRIDTSRYGHVGLYIGNGKIIHATSKSGVCMRKVLYSKNTAIEGIRRIIPTDDDDINSLSYLKLSNDTDGADDVGGEGGGRAVTVNTEYLNPYIVTVTRNTKTFDPKVLKKNKVIACMIEAGEQFNKSHKVRNIFRNPKAYDQAQACVDAGMEFGYWFTGRAKTAKEIDDEMYQLSFLVRKYPPALGVWIKIGYVSNKKSINDNLMKKYEQELLRLGLVDKMGIYCNRKYLTQFTWKNFQKRWWLWLDDPVKKVSDYEGLLDPLFFDTDGKSGPVIGPVGGQSGGVFGSSIEGSSKSNNHGGKRVTSLKGYRKLGKYNVTEYCRYCNDPAGTPKGSFGDVTAGDIAVPRSMWYDFEGGERIVVVYSKTKMIEYRVRDRCGTSSFDIFDNQKSGKCKCNTTWKNKEIYIKK